ncbi:hypothetical protein E4U54_001514 [Claviceps lovelessii]|nr:hypothetical protein E4U54_001514 [Claviceps lovelessii]
MPRKRPRLCEASPPATELSPPKKRKIYHPSVPPPRFWDNLSRLDLTRAALRELDRRNSKSNHQSRACTPSRGHHTRKTSNAERKTLLIPATQSRPTDQAQLKRSARHGGFNLKDLRGHPPPNWRPKISSRQSSRGRRGRRGSRGSRGRRGRASQTAVRENATTNATTQRTTGPYNGAFEQHLIDHNIFPPLHVGDRLPDPKNLNQIRRVLEKRRRSLSPRRFTDEDFEKFQHVHARATRESRVVGTVIPIIEGDIGDPACAASDIAFSNLEHLTDGSLVFAKPGLYHGARAEHLKREIREDLNGLIAPSSEHDQPILPNNFLEVKGPAGSSTVVTRQATYSAALGSRAFHALQTYRTIDQSYDNNSYVLAWTYQSGHLLAYASYPVPPSTPGTQPGYAMKILNSWSLIGAPDMFRQGVAAYRNGRDWAKLQRDQAIARANEAHDAQRML